MRAAAGLLLLCLALAGCTSPPPQQPPPGEDSSRTHDPAQPPGAPPPATNGTAAPSIDGPRWDLGDAWTYTLRTPEGEVTQELVVFRADGEHWWLGLENRTFALEHALRDTNPLLGRIHYGILSPHEQGRHAGMYSFPLEDGKAWSGDLFGGTWQFRCTWDAAQQRYAIEGTGANASRITLDYEPAVEWFSELRLERDVTTLELALREHRTGVSGTFHFFRGVDVYAGPGPAGPLSGALHTDDVQVEDGFDGLGLSLRAAATAPGFVAVVDPANQERWRRAVEAGEVVDELAELPAMGGTWRVLYVGLANMQAEVRLAGLEAHIESV